jgi:hypothetical protein
MTVANLIKQLQRLPQKAKIAIDVSYSGKKEWTYEMVELKPKFVSQVDMAEDWHEHQKGRPHNIDMVILGTIVGDNLE